MNTTLAIRKSCSTSDIGLVPNVSQVAASDVGDDPAVKTFTQNVQKVQDEITALKAELAVAKAGMSDAALSSEDKAMFRSDVTRINTEIERLGRKEELLLQLMLEKMKQVKEAKDAAKKAADMAVQSELTDAEKNDRMLGELRHSDIDTLVCWRAWSAAMPLVTGTGGGAGRKSVSFWTCSCQREIIDYPSTTCKCVRDCPYVSDRYTLLRHSADLPMQPCPHLLLLTFNASYCAFLSQIPGLGPDQDLQRRLSGHTAAARATPRYFTSAQTSGLSLRLSPSSIVLCGSTLSTSSTRLPPAPSMSQRPKNQPSKPSKSRGGRSILRLQVKFLFEFLAQVSVGEGSRHVLYA